MPSLRKGGVEDKDHSSRDESSYLHPQHSLFVVLSHRKEKAVCDL